MCMLENATAALRLHLGVLHHLDIAFCGVKSIVPRYSNSRHVCAQTGKGSARLFDATTSEPSRAKKRTLCDVRAADKGGKRDVMRFNNEVPANRSLCRHIDG